MKGALLSMAALGAIAFEDDPGNPLLAHFAQRVPPRGDPSPINWMPHLGKRECERRMRQMAKITTRTTKEINA